MILIDLHGLTEAEAILQIDSVILDLKNGYEDEAEIVTGNGIVLKDLAIDMVNRANLNWYYRGKNTGAIIVESDWDEEEGEWY